MQLSTFFAYIIPILYCIPIHSAASSSDKITENLKSYDEKPLLNASGNPWFTFYINDNVAPHNNTKTQGMYGQLLNMEIYRDFLIVLLKRSTNSALGKYHNTYTIVAFNLHANNPHQATTDKFTGEIHWNPEMLLSDDQETIDTQIQQLKKRLDNEAAATQVTHATRLPSTSLFRLYYACHKLFQPVNQTDEISKDNHKILVAPNGNYAIVVTEIDRTKDFMATTRYRIDYTNPWAHKNPYDGLPRLAFKMIYPTPFEHFAEKELNEFKERPYKNQDEEEFYKKRMTLLNMTPYLLYAALYSKEITSGRNSKLTSSSSGRPLDILLEPFGQKSMRRPLSGFLQTEKLLVAIDKTIIDIGNKELLEERLNKLVPPTYCNLDSLKSVAGAEFNEYRLGDKNQEWDGILIDTTYDGRADTNLTTINFNAPFKFSQSPTAN